MWSLVLAGAGVWLLANPRPNGPTPFGNGTPLFLLAGGGTAAAICGLLWCLTLGSGISRSHRALRGIRWALFVLALLILAAGIVRHAPRRDPFVVAAASVALGFSALAQRRERRFRYSGVVSHRFPTGEHGPSFSCGAGEPS